MAKDQQGLTLAGSKASAEAFDRAVADYYALTGDPVGALKQALAADPGFALGGVAVAGLFMIGGFSRRPSRGRRSAFAPAEAAIGRSLGPRKAPSRGGQGVGRGPGAGGDAGLGGDSHRLADRRAGAAFRAGRLFLSRPVDGATQFDRARAACLGSRQSADELRPRGIRLRARGDGRARARRRRRPRGAEPQSARRVGRPRYGARDGDGEPPGGGHGLSQGVAARLEPARISWRATTAGISPSI